ncbi:MAG: DinB family protein [Chloroflexi bacterium]|nr:DinB family protein [Chloroflexota bacterium]
MTRDEILQTIKRAHENFLETIADIPDDIATTQRVIDWWTLKDVLGHISTWYLVARQFIREYARGNVPTPLGLGQSDDEIDRYNKRAAALRRDYSLARVRAELDAAYRDLIAAVEALSDADVSKQLPAPWDAGDNLEKLIAVNSYVHLPEHIDQINTWRSK